MKLSALRAICFFVLLLSLASAFMPLYNPPNAILLKGKGCSQLIEGKNFNLEIFKNNVGEVSFGGGGNIGLSGGIEVAIDPLFCQRMVQLREDHAKYNASCAMIITAVQQATAMWSSRHPSLYFNWTNPITNTDAAELVISTDWELFREKEYKTVLGFDSSTSLGPRTLSTVRTTSSSAKHRDIPAAYVSRHLIMMNPYTCWYYTDAHVQVCSQLTTVLVSRSVLITTLVLACLGLYNLAILLINGSCFAVTRYKFHDVQVIAPARDNPFAAEIEKLQRQLALLRRTNSEKTKAAMNDAADNHQGVEAKEKEQGEEEEEQQQGDDDLACSLLAAHIKSMEFLSHNFELQNKASVYYQRVPRPDGYHFPYAVPLLFLFVSLCCLLLYKSIAHACPIVNGENLRFFNVGDESKKECFNFEHILAHEIGHALGIGHSDGNYRLDDNHNSSLHDFININHADPCNGLKLIKTSDCKLLNDKYIRSGSVIEKARTKNCLSTKNCHVSENNVCESAFSSSLMFSAMPHQVTHGHAIEGPLKSFPSSDDIAALFFLYPNKKRNVSWGTKPLSLSDYSSNKLKVLAEDFFDGACSSLISRQDLYECLNEQKASASLNYLELMSEHICSKKSTSSGCKQTSSLRRSVQEALEHVREGRRNANSTDSDWRAADAQAHSDDVSASQRRAEDALQDVPNTYTAQLSPDIDRLIDALLDGPEVDENKDGVRDADKDGDGLPDDIEVGLDVLREILSDVANGAYKGEWDIDGDGVANDEDNRDDRRRHSDFYPKSKKARKRKRDEL